MRRTEQLLTIINGSTGGQSKRPTVGPSRIMKIILITSRIWVFPFERVHVQAPPLDGRPLGWGEDYIADVVPYGLRVWVPVTTP